MGWFRRLLGREQLSVEDRRGESDVWRPGDLAVCILDNWPLPWSDNPSRGDLLCVAEVYDAIGHTGEIRSYFLRFQRKSRQHGWDHIAFRKVRHDAEPCEEDFKNLVKRPVRQPEKVGEWR